MRCRSCSRVALISGFCRLHAGRRCACGLTPGNMHCTVCRPQPGPVKKHEMHVKAALESHGELDCFIHNKTVPGTRLSPDFLWECPSHYVILEVDEYGHKSYCKKQEVVRMEKISQAFKKQVTFVRLDVPCNDDRLTAAIDALQALTCSCSATTATTDGITIHSYMNGTLCK